MPGFLRTMDTALDGDGSAWQGYYTVREPGQSPATALRYAALVLRHYVRPLGRTALGGSCGLFGNGMVFRTDLHHTRYFGGGPRPNDDFRRKAQILGFIMPIAGPFLQ